MRQSTLLFVFLALVVGFVLFKVKYEVVEIEQKLAQAQHQIDRERENIHILRAEWSHLNEPKRLQKLAGKYLDILPMKTDQVVAIIGNSENKDHFKGIFPRAHLASVKGVE
jgi:cell division protein FtsL